MKFFRRKPKYQIVTDEKCWAIKRTKDGLCYDFKSSGVYGYWSETLDKYCWTEDKDLAEQMLRRLEA